MSRTLGADVRVYRLRDAFRCVFVTHLHRTWHIHIWFVTHIHRGSRQCHEPTLLLLSWHLLWHTHTHTHTYTHTHTHKHTHGRKRHCHEPLPLLLSRASTVTHTHSHSHAHATAMPRTLAARAVKGIYSDTHTLTHTWMHIQTRTHAKAMPRTLAASMGWLRLVGSIKLQVSFAKESYKRDYILQKRPIIFRSLLIVATPHCPWHLQ